MKRAFSGLIAGAVLLPMVGAANKASMLEGLSPEWRKLDGQMVRALSAAPDAKSMKSGFLKAAPHSMRDGRVQVLVGMSGDKKTARAALEPLVDSIVSEIDSPEHLCFAVQISDRDQLDAILALSSVKGVAAEPKAVRRSQGSVANQADVTMGAANLRTLTGRTGAGIRIGVISDTLNATLGGTRTNNIVTGMTNQLSGDLPDQILSIDQGPQDGSGIDEGAAMAELIHDLAPGADISFASAFTSYNAFASNIRSLAGAAGGNCEIVVDDIIYLAEPVYQDGPIAIAARDVANNGVLYFSSAGNNGSDAHERPYRDFNAATDDEEFPPTGVDFHDFGLAKGRASQRFIQFNVPPNGRVQVVLQWLEPFGGTLGAGPGAQSDYDIYLLSSNTFPLTEAQILDAGAGPQGTPGALEGEPVEFTSWTNEGASTRTVYVAVDHFAGREAQSLFVILFAGVPTSYSVFGDRSLYGHAAADGAMAVGAIFYLEADNNGAFEGSAGVIDVESFSSLGGNLPFYFDAAGAALSSPLTRFKPDMTAVDGTNTTFFADDTPSDADAFPNFFGTSAAAPHAAAVAALLLEGRENRRAAIIPAMLDSARDIESAGRDALSGSGLVRAVEANELLEVPTGWLTQ